MTAPPDLARRGEDGLRHHSRVNAYEVVYIFTAGRCDTDRTRAYLPFAEAQAYFNREGRADEIEVMVQNPDARGYELPILQAAGNTAMLWTWQDSAGAQGAGYRG